MAKNAACMAAVSLVLTSNAQAAQYFVQPRVEVSAETNSNIELDSGIDGSDAQGYIAEASTVLGVATPRSETTIIPRLEYQEYPDLSEASRLQGDVAFESRFQSQRSSLSLIGGYEHLDELNGELSDARFDEVDTGQPLSTSSGRVRPGTVRDTASLKPDVSFKLTERTSMGGSVYYQVTSYDPNDRDAFIDYDFYRANVALERAITPRATIYVEPYLARYDARDLQSQTDSTGGAVGLEMTWSETFTANFDVSYQRAEIDQREPVLEQETVNSWGASVNLNRRGEIDELILSVGRGVTPSGGGSVYNTDQIQVQYDRDLSERLTLRTAARYIRDRSLAETVSSLDRDYGQADIGMEYMLSRTWYIRGGYEYTQQKYDFSVDTAENHQFSIGVGYRGIDRQR